MQSDLRFQAFTSRVRSLWSTYRASDDELYTRVWLPRLSKLPPDVVGPALAKHAAEHPDETKPKWELIYRTIGSRAGSTMSDLELLIMQYRRSKDRELRQRFAEAPDVEVWQYYVEAQIYPCMFGIGGRFKGDIDHAIRMGNRAVAIAIDSMTAKLKEAGDDVPSWLGDVGIPDRWLRACEAQRNA